MSQRLDIFRGKERCGVGQCRSKKFYVSDGLTFCLEGHQQNVATQTETIDDHRGRARKTRKEREKGENVSRVYSGARALELFLQAYQLILRKQCYAFVHTIGLPSELESVVKDLWALRLQLFVDKIDTIPEKEIMFSSQLRTGETEQAEDVASMQKTVLDKTMPSLMDTLGLCYLGMVLLRLPVGVGDLHRWAIRDDVPFIRAVRFVPAIMKEKLRAEYLLMLDTKSTLEPDHISKAIHNLGLFYRHHFDLNLPPLNAPLLLFKHIRELALPASLFPVVQSMAALLSIDFGFPKPGRYIHSSSSPEISLISLLVIAVKLYHPFDSLRRFVTSSTDPAILQIDWSKWTEAQAKHESRIQAGSHLVRGSEMHVTEEDAMQMSDGQIDDYLDWYERTWIDEDRARLKRRPLDEDFRKWFPTGRQDGSSPTYYDYVEQTKKEQRSTQQFSEDVMHAMMLRHVISEDDDEEEHELRIGSHYRRYRSSEDMNTDALAFHEAAANATGLSLETLLIAVVQIEQRLIDMRQRRPRGRPKASVNRDLSSSSAQNETDGRAGETEID